MSTDAEPWECLRSLAARRNAVHNQIGRYDVQKRNTRVLHEEMKGLEKEITIQSLRCSIAERRRFVNEFHTSLPPELRNMVYACAWEGHDSIKASSIFNSDNISISSYTPWMWDCTKSGAWGYKSDDCNCFDWYETPLWVIPLFVGHAVAQESAKVFYSQFMSPKALRSANLNQLKTFLTTDHLHLGLTPAHHLRRLHVNVGPWDSSDGTLGRRGFRGMDRTYIFEEKGLNIVKENLSALRLLKLRNGFELRVDMDRSLTRGQILDVMKILRPVYEELKGDGAIVEIWGCVDENHRDHCEDMTGWYEYNK